MNKILERQESYKLYAERRDSLNLKDASVAVKAEIPPSTFSDWKSGRCKPKMEKMQKIAKVLKCSISRFQYIPKEEK